MTTPSMQQPPLLPEETLVRVLRIARFDGIGALLLGGMFALSAAMAGEVPFAIVGLLGAGAGAIELHGTELLKQGYARGMNWLIASQPFLLLVITTYCAMRLWFIPLPPIPESLQGIFAASAAQWNMTVAEYQQALNRITVLAILIVALGFQGWMTLYYARRRKAVAAAFAEPS